MKTSFASIVWIYGSFYFSFSKLVEANDSQIFNESTVAPTGDPTTIPTGEPTTSFPTTTPTGEPSTTFPTITPTGEPTTSFPTSIPTRVPTTDNPTSTPTSAPTTTSPTAFPTKAPTTSSPTNTPTGSPTTANPTVTPTGAPTTSSPTVTPTGLPTTANPTVTPTGVPTTVTPTVTPTGAPTTPLPSSSPTGTPTTLQPTSSNDPNDAPIMECPSTSSSRNLTISGLVRFRNTNPGNLCTLTLVASDAASFKPVGRSYEGFDWEASSGTFSTLKWTCSSTLCIVNLPLAPTGSIYRLTTFTSSDVQRKPIDELFRFYEQASFGPTPNHLMYYSNDLASRSLKSHIHSWIAVQMLEAPATSHREIFRSRMNVRMEVDTRMAAVTHPCQEGTYYRKFAFTVRDSGKLMKVTSVGTKKVLRIDGFVRTVVQGPVHWTWDTKTHWPDDRLLMGGLTADKIGAQFYGYRNAPYSGHVVELSFNQVYGIPSIQFDASLNITPGIVVNLSPSNAKPIGLKYFQKEKVKEQLLMLTQNLTDAVCSTLGRPGNPIQPVFALYKGEYWMHDSRFQLLTNTLESPSPDGGGKLVQETFNVIDPERGTACANVARNFLNEDTCFYTDAKSACDADSFDPYKNFRQKFSVMMTPDLIRGIYNYTGKGADETLYVYAIDGLRVQEDQTIVYPCQKNAKSRWIPVSCTGAATNVDRTIHGIFAQLLFRSFDTNIFVRDIINNATGSCPVALEKLVGFEVQDQSGKCWKNVHPNHLNVYDFTYWTKYHPGNSVSRNPIKEFAVAGNSRMLFPGWHSMDRWYNNRANFGFAGRLGDEVNYFDLPLSLRSPYLNRHYGFLPEKISFPNSTC